MHAPTPLAGVNGTVCCEGDGLWPCGVRASGLSPRRGRRLTPQNPAAQHPDPSGRIQAARRWRRRRPAAGPGRARTAARRMQGGADAGAGAPGPPPGPGKAARAPALVRPDRRQAQARRRGRRRRRTRTAARRRQGGAGWRHMLHCSCSEALAAAMETSAACHRAPTGESDIAPARISAEL